MVHSMICEEVFRLLQNEQGTAWGAETRRGWSTRTRKRSQYASSDDWTMVTSFDNGRFGHKELCS